MRKNKMTTKDKVWKREDLGKRYLEGVRRAIPLADYQIKIILLLIQKVMPEVNSFLDLGCGDGVLGRAILSKYPNAKGVFLDFSGTMIAAARKKAPKNRKLFFLTQDYGKPSWVNSVKEFGKFDVVVSGFSIHHQTDKRKKEIYKEVFDLLRLDGLFLNLEHVSSPSHWLQHIFDEFFVDSLYSYHRSIGSSKTRVEIAKHHYKNPLKKANILAPVEMQCSWLRKIGFKEVDCYLKIFELALFGGIKSKN
jgi:SAM-dependent methyltransferase